MAEYQFQEVMHHWKRMCDAMLELYGEASCDDDKCPLGGFGCPAIYELDDKDDVDWDKRAEHIMNWAKENPEPVYPTWAEWLVQQKVLASVEPTHQGYISAYYGGENMHCQIPKQMAEALNIKPSPPPHFYGESAKEFISDPRI